MDEIQLKQAFQTHMASREAEKPSREMLYEFFREGYKLGSGKQIQEPMARAMVDIETQEEIKPKKSKWY
jgi:hypothetical protein